MHLSFLKKNKNKKKNCGNDIAEIGEKKKEKRKRGIELWQWHC